ncbi:MAG: phosphoenolpyruvate--protein phosphotransferase, partial [Planctomycetes bacterium]|nr:phosphoenolpyruvate--protein phosphotransferase [Planctomycetota bacterium]
IDSEEYRIPRRSVKPSQRMREILRVRSAFKDAAAELAELEASQDRTQAGKIKDIFAVHLRFLRDRSLRKEVTDLVYAKSVAAEFAVSTVLRKIATHFSNVKDAYISERAADIYDIESRLLRNLLGESREDINHLSKEVVVVTRDLTPTQTAGFDRRFIRGIATDAGGRTSHTAIVARSMGIPAVVALEDFVELVRPGDSLIIDGNRGVVILEPNEETLSEYRRHQADFNALENRLNTIREKPATTRDGVRVTLLGNIEFPDESNEVLKRGGDGIGLYRTEFLYLNRSTNPTEEEHYEAYAQVIQTCQGRPVTLRTVDLGADKHMMNRRFAPEPNPFLGLRSIRYCLHNIPLFKTQLRAVLRASALGPIKVMFPLITNLQELRQAKLIFRDVMEDLHEEGLPYAKDVQLGIMIETPSAALVASALARESDFFSIGTNDLTQYTLAVDRGNELVSTLYSPVEPSVLRLIRSVIQDAHRHQVQVSVCGEMASEPEYVMLLIGMGVRTLSMTPPMIPEVKQIIRSVTIEDCNRVARHVLAMDSERQITSYLRSRARAIIPEAF